MKILLMHDNNKPEGGACQVFYDEAKLLTNKGHTVHLFTLDQIANSQPYTKDARLQTVYIEPKDPSIAYFFQKYFSLKLFITFIQTVKKFDPDIIHIHHNLKSTLSIILAAKLYKKPIVHTMHDVNLACISSYGVNKKTGEICNKGTLRNCFKNRCFPATKFLKYALLWKLRQWVEKNYVDIILCPSKFLMATLSKLGYRNLEYLPNFVSLPQEVIKNTNNTPKRPYIIYVGRFIELKGVYYLIKAFKTILKTFPHARLLLIGNGQEKKELKSYAVKLGIKKKITFIDELSHEEISFYYKNSYVCVLPSIGIESFGLTVIEAMSFGLPVVASDIGGIPELIENGKTGFLCKPRDDQDLAKKILKILNDPMLTKNMGVQAKKISRLEYSKKKHYTGLIKIYKLVLSQKHENN